MKKKQIWDLANMTMTEFRDLPWPKKKIIILKYGPLPEALVERTKIERLRMPNELKGIIYGKDS